MSDIECPYCGYKNDDVYTERREPDITYTYEDCAGCGKNFGYIIDYTIYYCSKELPCANGEEHKWKEYVNVPSVPYILFRCEYCGLKEHKLREQKQVTE